MEPMITTRIYNPINGLVVDSKSDEISFGPIAPSSKSEIVILDALVSNVNSCGDFGIGIASTDLSGTLFPGVLYYSILDTVSNVAEPTTSFTGISGTGGLNHVVSVGSKSAFESKYIALMIQAPDDPQASGCIILKWFFGFQKKEV